MRHAGAWTSNGGMLAHGPFGLLNLGSAVPSMLVLMPDEAGDLIGGRYLLAEPASQGGRGRLWRGQDQLLDREVAVTQISLPPRPGADRARVVEAVMREVRAAARRGGRGGIMIHDVIEHADALWVVTQPGDGESLGAAIAPDRAAPGTVAPGTRAPQAAPSSRGPIGRSAGRLAAVLRANPGLAVGVATGIVMILALLLVVALFPSHHQP